MLEMFYVFLGFWFFVVHDLMIFQNISTPYGTGGFSGGFAVWWAFLVPAIKELDQEGAPKCHKCVYEKIKRAHPTTESMYVYHPIKNRRVYHLSKNNMCLPTHWQSNINQRFVESHFPQFSCSCFNPVSFHRRQLLIAARQGQNDGHVYFRIVLDQPLGPELAFITRIDSLRAPPGRNVYLYMYIYIHTYMHVYLYIYIYVYIFINIYIYL